jgi:hypothetical protein
MPTYYWHWNPETQTGAWDDAPAVRPTRAVQIMRDLPAYMSPLGDGKMIEGRAARREHLTANNCREVDPSEWKPQARFVRRPHMYRDAKRQPE